MFGQSEQQQHNNTNLLPAVCIAWDIGLEVYKITHDMYDRSVALELPRNVSSTRGNKYKLQNHSFHYNFRKFSFAARVVNVWNSLLDHVVDVNSLKQFTVLYCTVNYGHRQ